MNYTTIDPERLEPRAAYRLQISCLVPRPIAWVVSQGPDGTPNCAPFSYFMGVSSHPAIVAFAVGERRSGPKDTVRNIDRLPEFTINIVNEDLAAQMVQTSGEYDYGVSELKEAGLETLPSKHVKPPRIVGTPVQLECKVHQFQQVPETKATLILGRVLAMHVVDSVLAAEALEVDIHRLKPVGRLGGALYCRVRDIFELPRPEL